MANQVEKDAKADAEGVVAHLEKMWQKHFGNVSPGTELHAALDFALRDIRAGVRDLFGVKPKPTATPTPSSATAAAPTPAPAPSSAA